MRGIRVSQIEGLDSVGPEINSVWASAKDRCVSICGNALQIEKVSVSFPVCVYWEVSKKNVFFVAADGEKKFGSPILRSSEVGSPSSFLFLPGH